MGKKEGLYQLPIIDAFEIKRELILFDKLLIPETLIEQKKVAFEKSKLKNNIDAMYADLQFLIDHNQVEIVDLAKIVDEKLSFISKEENWPKIFKQIEDLGGEKYAEKMTHLSKKQEFIHHFASMRFKLREEISTGDGNIAEQIFTYLSFREKYDSHYIELGARLIELTETGREIIPVTTSMSILPLKANLENLKKFNSIDQNDIDLLILSEEQSDIMNLVLKKIPVPTKNVSLEHLLEFKSDRENIRKLRDLNRWIKKMVYKDLSIYEIEEEIEYLLSEYERILNLHKIKYMYSTAEILINVTLGTLEKLLKLKFGAIGKSYFEMKRAQADLSLIESQLEGRELAYLLEAKKFVK